jgi:CheY-like chemotaxis protein
MITTVPVLEKVTRCPEPTFIALAEPKPYRITNYSGDIVHVLVVEDDPVDVEIIERAFRRKRISNPLHFAKDGFEALAILRGEEGRRKIPRPYVVLLDLNMPRMNGFEFLEELRQDETLRDSVVFVLSTSDELRDIKASYQQNVAGYLVKARVGEDFTDLVTMLDHYWRSVELP